MLRYSSGPVCDRQIAAMLSLSLSIVLCVLHMMPLMTLCLDDFWHTLFQQMGGCDHQVKWTQANSLDPDQTRYNYSSKRKRKLVKRECLPSYFNCFCKLIESKCKS